MRPLQLGPGADIDNDVFSRNSETLLPACAQQHGRNQGAHLQDHDRRRRRSDHSRHRGVVLAVRRGDLPEEEKGALKQLCHRRFQGTAETDAHASQRLEHRRRGRQRHLEQVDGGRLLTSLDGSGCRRRNHFRRPRLCF